MYNTAKWMLSSKTQMEDRTRVFEVPISCERTISIMITEPALRAESLSLETWASSQVLSNLLHRLKIKWPANADISPGSTVPILELGAGTALVGISAAAIYGVPTIVTDLAPIVPGLAANIDLNKAAVAAASSRVDCGTLDWNRPAQLHITNPDGDISIPSVNKAHVILAADTVYSEEHPVLMTSVITEWLSRDADARAIITYALRVAYLDEIRELWQRLEDAGLEAVEEGKDSASEAEFDDECLCEWSVWRWRRDEP